VLLQLGVANLVVYAPNAIKSFIQDIFSKKEKVIKSD
jgi:hypothetical protein